MSREPPPPPPPPPPGRRFKKRYVILALVLGLTGLVVWSGMQPPHVPEGSVLVLELSSLPERAPGGLGAFLESAPVDTTALHAVLARAATDPRILGLLVRLRGGALEAGAADEVRGAVARFSASKPAVAHLLSPDTLAYYVATGASQILLDQGSTLDTVGVHMNAFFLKGLLEELGVEMDLVRVGAYKGAFEELTLAGPTPELEESLNAIVESLDATIVGAVARTRQLEEAQVRALFDRAPLPGDEAVASKLVDAQATDAGVARLVEKRLGAGAVSWLPFENYAPQARSDAGAARLAIVHVIGAMVEGSEDELGLGGSTCGGDTVARAVSAAAADEAISGILLRVDSPGGVVSAADKIAHAVEEARKKKPVVATFAGMAASGGYFASCNADRILAQPTTLTGSLGVFGGKPVIQELLARHKVEVRTYARGARAGMSDFTRRYSEDERQAVKALMEMIYRDLVQRVARGRKMSFDQVDRVAQGRVWTGRQALEAGLVDELGGLPEASAALARLARLDPAQPVTLVPFPPPGSLWSSLGRRRPTGTPYDALGSGAPGWQALLDLLHSAGVLGSPGRYAISPQLLRIR